MATAKQIVANRAKAQLSTGPKTTEGKTHSAKNAVKNGFHTVPALQPEDRERFLQFEADLRESIEPTGALEEGAFLQFRDAAWRLEQLRRQVNVLESEDFEELQNQANRARAAAEMQLYRAIKTLEELQTTRLARFIHLMDEEQSIIPMCASPKAFAFKMIDGFKFNRADRDIFLATDGLTARPESLALATP